MLRRHLPRGPLPSLGRDMASTCEVPQTRRCVSLLPHAPPAPVQVPTKARGGKFSQWVSKQVVDEQARAAETNLQAWQSMLIVEGSID